MGGRIGSWRKGGSFNPYLVKKLKKVLPDMDDKLILKEAKDGRLIVKFMYNLLGGSMVFPFPFWSIWNPLV